MVNMKNFRIGTNKFCPLLLLLLWMLYGVEAQSSSYYRHEYFSPIVPRQRHYFRRSNNFGPVGYTRDSVPDESKHKVSPKKYSQPIPNRTSYSSEEDDFSSFERFHSGEYAGESRGSNSGEQDSREYTIGTRIHVQHPVTVPKKTSTLRAKPITKHSSYDESYGNERNTSSEIVHHSDRPSGSPLKRRPSKYTPIYEPDPFHVIPPPKTTSPGLLASSSIGYNVYENDFDDYKPSKSKSHDRFKGIASKKQIEAYLEDQKKKLLDEALKIQLLNNPEFKQFLKQKEKQRFEREHRQIYNEDDGIISPPVPPPSVFLENLEEGITFTTARPRRRPSEFKRSPKRKPPGSIKPNRKFRSAVVIEV